MKGSFLIALCSVLGAGWCHANPVISEVYANRITAINAFAIWGTDTLADEQVELGTSTSYGTTLIHPAYPATAYRFHSFRLNDLTPATTYHFRVRSQDANGPTVSGDYTFVTFPLPGTGQLQGAMLKDDNGNGQFNAGELYIRDALFLPCTFNDYPMSGLSLQADTFKAGFGIAMSFCTSSGTPGYQVTLPPGDYVVRVLKPLPLGWIVTSPDEIPITITNGGTFTLNFAVQPPGPPLNRCDFNASGSSDVSDVQLLVNAILSGNTSATFDVNRDASINILDIQTLVNVILGLGICPA